MDHQIENQLEKKSVVMKEEERANLEDEYASLDDVDLVARTPPWGAAVRVSVGCICNHDPPDQDAALP